MIIVDEACSFTSNCLVVKIPTTNGKPVTRTSLKNTVLKISKQLTDVSHWRIVSEAVAFDRAASQESRVVEKAFERRKIVTPPR